MRACIYLLNIYVIIGVFYLNTDFKSTYCFGVKGISSTNLYNLEKFMFTKKENDYLKQLFVFLLTPTVEVAVTQPIWSLMKQLQVDTVAKPAIKYNLRTLYSGVTYNWAGFSGTIVFQMAMTKAILDKMSDNPSSNQEAFAALFAGVASSLIACPTDALMLKKLSPNFKPKLFGSMPATMAQEGTCSFFFMFVAPLLGKCLQPYIKNKDLNAMVSGSLSGLGAAVIPHPANTIRSFQQTAEVQKGVVETGAYIYSRYGAMGLFKGLGARGAMVGASIGVMHWTQDFLSKVLDVGVDEQDVVSSSCMP